MKFTFAEKLIRLLCVLDFQKDTRMKIVLLCGNVQRAIFITTPASLHIVHHWQAGAIDRFYPYGVLNPSRLNFSYDSLNLCY